MNRKKNVITIACFFIVFSSHLLAQNKFEKLPRHQINASLGQSKSSGFFHPNLPNLKTGGLAYTVNIGRRFWASAEWQTGFSKFDWLDYETLKVFPYTGLSTEKLTEIPVYYKNDLDLNDNINTAFPNAPLTLMPSNGFYEFRNWAILAGYQRSSPRNALRFGLGASAIQVQSRMIRFTQGVNTNQYLNEMKVLNWYANAAIQYDYWLTPKIAIGMRLTAVLGVIGNGPDHTSAMLSVGYAIPKFRKTKIQPRA
jgi:hypothetical protein